MLLDELRKIPAFNKFEQAVNKELTKDNFYVQHFMPEVGEYWDEGYDENGRTWSKEYTTEEQAEQLGIDFLLEDKGVYFEEFITEVLRDEIVALGRALIEEIRK